jgi:hypothetical protein
MILYTINEVKSKNPAIYKDIKTTANIYAHVTPKKKEKAAHKMDGLLRKHS